MSAEVRVLIVDDEEDVAEMLTEVVESFGHRALMVIEAERALQVAREFLPHVVLLDLNMPNIDGGTMLERLRASSPSLAVIMVTANADEEQAKALLASGAFDYVTKPVDFAYLRLAIAAAVATAP